MEDFIKLILRDGNLITESLLEYIDGGNIMLYHYTKSNKDKLILDPIKFAKGNYQNYSRNDYQISNVPRVFFYLNLRDKESFFNSGASLYKKNVNATNIYDIIKDPERLKDEHRHSAGNIDFDGLLQDVSGWERDGNSWNKKRSKYNGMYYKPGGIEVVIWFEKITVKMVPEDEQRELER